MENPEPLLSVQHLGADAQPFEVVEDVRFNAFQPGLCRADVVGIDTEGEILGFHNAAVALCLLLLDDFGQLPLDAFKLIRTQRDCPGKGFPQGGQIHEGKLEFDGAVEIIEEVAPAVEDGLLVLVVRELVVDVPELDSFGEMGGRDLTDTVYTDLQVGNAVLCGHFLLICPLCP